MNTSVLKNRFGRHICLIILMLTAFAAVYFAYPSETVAAGTSVKIGGTEIGNYNDNQWHYYNSKSPAISGWTAGRYKLSSDKSVLYVDGFRYSGSKTGITSTAALKIVASGTNTFTCSGAAGIVLGSSASDRMNLTLDGAAGSTLNIKCTNTDSIDVSTFALHEGTVNAAGRLSCSGNISVSGGNLTVTGDAQAGGNVVIKGGTTNITGSLKAENPDKGVFSASGGSISIGGQNSQWHEAYISGGSATDKEGFFCDTLTLSGGSLTSGDCIYVYVGGLTGTAGTLSAEKHLYVYGNMTVSGADITARTEGIQVYGNLEVSKGTLTGSCNTTNMAAGILVDGNTVISGTGKVTASAEEETAYWAIGTITLSGGSLETIHNAIPNPDGGSHSGLDAKSVNVTGGSLTAIETGSSGNAIAVDENMTISGGTVTAACSNDANDWIALYCVGDISVNGGNLTVTGSSAGRGLVVEGNSAVSGNASVKCTSGSGEAFRTYKTLTVKGGLVDVFTDHSGISLSAGTMNVTGGTVNAGTDGRNATIIVDGTMTVTGGTVTGTITSDYNRFCAVQSQVITVTGGSLSGSSNSFADGIRAYEDFNISGTGVVRGTSANGNGVWCNGKLMISGGRLETESYRNGASANEVNVNGGEIISVSSNGYGLVAGTLNVSAGTVDCETASTDIPYPAVFVRNTFKMTGGSVSGKTASSEASPVSAPLEGTELADDIWMSKPADGYNTLNDGYSSDQLIEYEHSGTIARAATFRKVSSIAVRQSPAREMFAGDRFDPEGLVLTLTFADGTESDLTYDDKHKNLFTFDISQTMPLTAGSKTVGVTCLTKTASFSINVKDLGTSTLSGTTTTGSAELRWTGADGATGYQVYGRQEGSRDYSLLTTVTGQTACTRSGLSPGETWDFYICPLRHTTSGNVVYGNSSNILTLTTRLTAPSLSITGNSYDSLSLEWDKAKGAEGYCVYRDADGEGFRLHETLYDPDVTKYTDSQLVTGIEYHYYVTAVKPSKDLESSESNTVQGVPAFTGTTVLEATGTGVNELRWSAVDGASGYDILRGDGPSGTSAVIAEVPASEDGDLTYTDTSADKYSVYNYTIRPKRFAGEKTFYATDSNTVVTEALEKEPVITPPKTEDPAGTEFSLLQARAGKVTKKSVLIKWKKVKGAKKYIIYGNKCGVKNKYRKLKTTTKTSQIFTKVAGKKVAKGIYYKFIIYAVDSKGRTLSTSKTIHVATLGGKVGNDKKVTTAAKKNKVTLKKGKSFRLRARAIPASKTLKVHRHRKMAYETSNKKVAAVNSKGVIKAKGRGICYVYAYTQNGISARIKVIVK